MLFSVSGVTTGGSAATDAVAMESVKQLPAHDTRVGEGADGHVFQSPSTAPSSSYYPSEVFSETDSEARFARIAEQTRHFERQQRKISRLRQSKQHLDLRFRRSLKFVEEQLLHLDTRKAKKVRAEKDLAASDPLPDIDALKRDVVEQHASLRQAISDSRKYFRKLGALEREEEKQKAKSAKILTELRASLPIPYDGAGEDDDDVDELDINEKRPWDKSTAASDNDPSDGNIHPALKDYWEAVANVRHSKQVLDEWKEAHKNEIIERRHLEDQGVVLEISEDSFAANSSRSYDTYLGDIYTSYHEAVLAWQVCVQHKLSSKAGPPQVLLAWEMDPMAYPTASKRRYSGIEENLYAPTELVLGDPHHPYVVEEEPVPGIARAKTFSSRGDTELNPSSDETLDEDEDRLTMTATKAEKLHDWITNMAEPTTESEHGDRLREMENAFPSIELTSHRLDERYVDSKHRGATLAFYHATGECSNCGERLHLDAPNDLTEMSLGELSARWKTLSFATIRLLYHRLRQFATERIFVSFICAVFIWLIFEAFKLCIGSGLTSGLQQGAKV